MIEYLGDRKTVPPADDLELTAKSRLGKLAFAALWKIRKFREPLLQEFDRYNREFYETKMGPQYKIDYECWRGLNRLLKRAIKDRDYNPDGDAQKLIAKTIDRKYKLTERSVVFQRVTLDDGTVLENLDVPYDNGEEKHYWRIFTRFTNKYGIFPWYWGANGFTAQKEKAIQPKETNTDPEKNSKKMRDIEPQW